MATRKVVPREDGEGGLGSLLKRWLVGHFVSLFCDDLTFKQLKTSGGDGSYVQLPSVTTTQRDALTPAVGMIVYNSTVGGIQKYTGSVWSDIAVDVTGSEGDVVYHDATGWTTENTGSLNTPTRTLVLLGGSLICPETNGATFYEESLTGGRLLRGAEFVASASAIVAEIGHPMPTNWDGGTVTAQFIFATVATTGTVIMSLAGRASISDDAIDQAFGTPQGVTFDIAVQTGEAAWDLWTTDPTSAITLAGSPQGVGRKWVQWQITRDAADTCAESVVLLAVIVEYGTNGYSDA